MKVMNGEESRVGKLEQVVDVLLPRSGGARGERVAARKSVTPISSSKDVRVLNVNDWTPHHFADIFFMQGYSRRKYINQPATVSVHTIPTTARRSGRPSRRVQNQDIPLLKAQMYYLQMREGRLNGSAVPSESLDHEMPPCRANVHRTFSEDAHSPMRSCKQIGRAHV